MPSGPRRRFQGGDAPQARTGLTPRATPSSSYIDVSYLTRYFEQSPIANFAHLSKSIQDSMSVLANKAEADKAEARPDAYRRAASVLNSLTGIEPLPGHEGPSMPDPRTADSKTMADLINTKDPSVAWVADEAKFQLFYADSMGTKELHSIRTKMGPALDEFIAKNPDGVGLDEYANSIIEDHFAKLPPDHILNRMLAVDHFKDQARNDPRVIGRIDRSRENAIQNSANAGADIALMEVHSTDDPAAKYQLLQKGIAMMGRGGSPPTPSTIAHRIATAAQAEAGDDLERASESVKRTMELIREQPNTPGSTPMKLAYPFLSQQLNDIYRQQQQKEAFYGAKDGGTLKRAMNLLWETAPYSKLPDGINEMDPAEQRDAAIAGVMADMQGADPELVKVIEHALKYDPDVTNKVVSTVMRQAPDARGLTKQQRAAYNRIGDALRVMPITDTDTRIQIASILNNATDPSAKLDEASEAFMRLSELPAGSANRTAHFLRDSGFTSSLVSAAIGPEAATNVTRIFDTEFAQAVSKLPPDATSADIKRTYDGALVKARSDLSKMVGEARKLRVADFISDNFQEIKDASGKSIEVFKAGSRGLKKQVELIESRFGQEAAAPLRAKYEAVLRQRGPFATANPTQVSRAKDTIKAIQTGVGAADPSLQVKMGMSSDLITNLTDLLTIEQNPHMDSIAIEVGKHYAARLNRTDRRDARAIVAEAISTDPLGLADAFFDVTNGAPQRLGDQPMSDVGAVRPSYLSVINNAMSIPKLNPSDNLAMNRRQLASSMDEYGKLRPLFPDKGKISPTAMANRMNFFIHGDPVGGLEAMFSQNVFPSNGADAGYRVQTIRAGLGQMVGPDEVRAVFGDTPNPDEVSKAIKGTREAMAEWFTKNNISVTDQRRMYMSLLPDEVRQHASDDPDGLFWQLQIELMLSSSAKPKKTVFLMPAAPVKTQAE